MKNKFYYNNTQTEYGITRLLIAEIEYAVNTALLSEDVKKPCDISITFTNDSGIQELNCEYRNKNIPTDVLSFPMYNNISECKENTVTLGDIVINMQRADIQAKQLEHSLNREVVFLCIHSVLHLLGYDHEISPFEDERMCERQRIIIERVYGHE